MRPDFSTEGTYTPDNLIAGDFPLRGGTVTIASGQDLTRGAVLGKVTATGEYVLSLAAASDGSQVPDRILAEDIDATGGATPGAAYEAGEFNERALTIGAGHTIASIREGLRQKSIFLRNTVKG